ncbi:MAG: ABC transporter ATP-binding protein [Dehalogenimonas sp.]
MNTPIIKPIIECCNLSKTFQVRKNKIPVLENITFSVAPGEVVVIRGRSGAGKSVLNWLLSGLDHPDSGEIIFKGESLKRMSNSKLAELRANHIGIIFQNFNLIASWTAMENATSSMEQKGLSRTEIQNQATAIISKLGLADRADNLPSELSMGQQQRIAVARTIAAEPELILADEPTGDVDPETAEEIIELLLSEVKRRNATLIITTHGHFPCRYADRVFVLENRRLSQYPTD